MVLAAGVLGPTAAAALSVALLVGLPLLVAAATVVVLVHQERRESKAGRDEPWWHAHAMEAEQTAVGSSSQRLMGGSRPGALPSCNHCSKTDPPLRCAGCSSVAYCSRECQQADWKAGHKHTCKKLRKQRQAEARRAAAGEADGSSAAADDSTAASEAKDDGSKERPEESNSTPPLPKQVLYPAERYAELAAAPPQRKAPLGLVNVGNSCYANSLLQSLIATPALAAYLVSGEHGRSCRKPSASDWCALCELEKLTQQAYDKSSGCLSPKPLLKHVKRLGKQFSFGRQEDSHELYLRLMEAIEAVQLVEAGGKARFDLRSRETVLIHHVFGGYTRNQVACRSCGHVSRTYEACTSLTLEVSARVTSLEAALQRFAAVERLDGDNKYKCDGCKSYVAADKSTRIEAAPHNLNICLKRFAPGRYGKITTRLTFPDSLDLSPYMAEGSVDAASGSGPPLYRLYAVVVHIDWGRSTDYGHYIAYVKNGGNWFQCDDSSVTPVAAAKALSAGAYLLFYEREAPRRILTADEAAAAALAKAAVAAESAAESVASAAQEGAGSAAAASAAEDAASRQGGMLRVETAPASLPHLGAPSSSFSLSATSSQELPVVLEVHEARQHHAAQAIEAGTPEALHASVSESDLLAARLRSGGTGATGCVTAASVASLRVPSRIAEEAADADLLGSPSTRLEQQQQELAAAADQARSEVEARKQQQAGQPAAPSSGSTPSSSRSSGSSSGSGGGSTDFRPTANPFNLLVPEDSEEDDDGSSSNSSSGGDASGSERGAAEAEAEVVRPSSTAGEEEERLLASPAAALAAAEEQAGAATEPEQPAARSTAAAEAMPSAAQPADVQPAEAAANDAPAAGDAVADDAGKQAAEQQGSSRDAATAEPPVEEQAVPGSSSAGAAPTDDSQRTAAGGEATAADACGAEGEQPQPAAAEQQLGASTAATAGSVCMEEACTPAHRASLKCVADGKRVLRLSVDLPGVESLEHVDWRVQAGGGRAGGSASQQLLLRAAPWQLALPLPVPVEGGSAAAKWAREKLTVTWPVA